MTGESGPARPQLTCGDAVSFLDARCFLERLRMVQPEGRALLFAKFLALLLVYGAYDYAAEIAARRPKVWSQRLCRTRRSG